MRMAIFMKTTLRISILFNLAMVGSLAYLAATARRPDPEPLPASQPAPLTMTATLPPETPVTAEPAQPMRWSQMCSTSDYRDFIKKLRTLGCPEVTIHDIVAGDARRAFAYKRRQLKLDGSGAGAWSHQAETRLVASLMGEVNRADVAQSSTPAPALKREPETVEYPLVFKNVDLDALGLDADQKEAVALMQQQFMNAIGGPNQDPGDPAYRARWQAAQSEMDDTMRGMLGADVFENLQMAAQDDHPESPAEKP